MADNPHVSLTAEFNMALGWFYTAWAATEGAMDCAICRFLRLTLDEAHLLTAGMEHGRKATPLRALIKKSDHKNKQRLLTSLNTIQNESLRNVFAHSYIGSDEKYVYFVERSKGGSYFARERQFTLKEFQDHVERFLLASQDFEQAMEFLPLELGAFQHAALSIEAKATTSPEPPSSKTL